jgi:hypothetical protein
MGCVQSSGMSVVTITMDGLGDAMESAVNIAVKLRALRKDKKWLQKQAGLIDEMLRNPYHPFRYTSRIAAVLDDRSEDFADTRAILTRLKGVRHNAGLLTFPWVGLAAIRGDTPHGS